MNATTETLGGKWYRGGRTQRAQRTVIALKGVEITVEYIPDGANLPATDIDDACDVTAIVMSAQIGGVDVWHLIGDTQLGEQIVEAVEGGLR